MLAGSPQQGQISLSFAYKYIISQRLMARVDSREAEMKPGLWAGVRRGSPWRPSWCQEGLTTPMAPSWLPRQHSAEKNPVTVCSLPVLGLHYPSLGLRSAFPHLPAYARVPVTDSQSSFFLLYDSHVVLFAIMCVSVI